MADATDNIAKALGYKEEGNTHFKAGEYKKAMVAYHNIFMYVHGFSEKRDAGSSSAGLMPGSTTQAISPEQWKQVSELKVASASNLAMCHLKLGNTEKARDNCTKALAIEPANVKALFRRGKCHAALNAIDEAKDDFEAVLAADPANREAPRELQALKSKFAARHKKEQKKFAGFFDKLHADDPPAAAPAAVDPQSVPPQPAAETGGSLQARLDAAAADGMPPLEADDDDDDIGEPLGAPQAFEPSSAGVK